MVVMLAVACTPGGGLDDGNDTEQPSGGDNQGGGNTGNPNAPVNPEDVPADKTRAIKFQDDNAKLICTLHWDENGDGELSYEEAAAVTSLGTAFKGSRILAFTELEYFTGITDIAKEEFIDCASLVNISLPKQITNIGTNAFSGCTNLKKVNIPDLSAWCKIDFSGSNANPLNNGAKLYINGVEQTNITIPSDITEIKFCAFANCSSLTSVTIPDSVNGSIGSSAFEGCSRLTSVTIGNSVTQIKESAFSGCNSLKSVTIGNSVNSIGAEAFSSCGSLTSVTIGNSVTSIGAQAFYDCTGELIVNSKIVETDYNRENYPSCKPSYAGYPGWLCGAKFTKLTIGDNITKIGDYAFYNCNSLTSVTIPDSVTSIGGYAFDGCDSLTDVYVNIADLAAYATSNNTYNFTGNIHLLVNGSEITELVIPDSVTSIESYAFRGCSSLTSVTIPDSVTSIGSYAFQDCSSLLAFYGKYASSDNRCLVIDGVLSYFVPSGLTSYTIPNSITSIGDYAFYGCDGLTSVTIPNSVTYIGGSAFYGCNSLTNLTIPDSVNKIGASAFYGCSSLTSITIPDSVTSIGKYAFYGCSGLKSVTIGRNITNDIGQQVFAGCTGELIVNCYTIRGAKTSIGYEDGVFYGSKFTKVTIGDNVTSIGVYAFPGCQSLTSVTIGNSVKTIDAAAFMACQSLTSITIPDSVTSIGTSAFQGCSSLTKVYCKPKTPPTGGSSMFSTNASGRKIYVPTMSVNLYKSKTYWKDYASDIVGYDF